MNRRFVVSGLLLCLLQGAVAYEEELRFVAGLTEKGFPGLAEKILFRTLEKYPEADTQAPELRIRILIAARKFDEAAKQIEQLQNPPRPADTSPAEGTRKNPLRGRNARRAATDGEDLWLFLAESAYAANRKPVSENAYKNYFKTASEPDAQAAFNYGALLEERDDDAAAIRLYKQVESRPVQSRLAALLVESEPDRALKLSEEVQLGGLDLWFGSAVVTWAQVMIGKDEWDETQSVLEGQLELLNQLEGSLEQKGQPVSLISPLAGARYFLGQCYKHAGKKADALTQFYNVYAKYGDSEWGPTAHEKAQALIADFEAQGKTVKIDPGTNLAKMEQSAFRVARRLFLDREYADAFPAYIAVLNDYPEGGESITALHELMLCAIHLDDELSLQTIGFYLAERFSPDVKAGDALLAAGKAALDAKKEEQAWALYEWYLSGFPHHSRAPAVLYSLSGLREKEDYLFRIVEHYPESPWKPRALGRLAWNAFQAEQYELAAERFAPYVETEVDPQKRTRARFAFGESHRFSKEWKNALEKFQRLETEMADAAAGFGVSAETLAFNRPFWEKSIYYQAVCHKEIGEVDAAVECCDRFLDRFSTSDIAEQVRFAKAETLMDSERFEAARVALDGIGGKFSEAVTYYRGVALYETGAYEESCQTLETLLNKWPASAFIYEAMFVQGRALTAAGRTEDAVHVFGEIMRFASNDELLHRASLELGRAQDDPNEKLASFQRVALLADPETHRVLIAEALFESLPLYLELNRPADLLADADRLTETFPTFGHSEKIAILKTKAETENLSKNKKNNGSSYGGTGG